MNGEYIDLYDNNKKLTGEKIFREKGKKANVPTGKYSVVVIAFIKNHNNKYLLQKTTKNKGGIWSLTGGHVKSGQTSLEAIPEEIKEELGLHFPDEMITLLKTYKYENAFKDVYYINSDIDLDKIKLQIDEVEDVNFFTEEKIYKLIDEEQIRKTNIDAILDFFKENKD